MSFVLCAVVYAAEEAEERGDDDDGDDVAAVFVFVVLLAVLVLVLVVVFFVVVVVVGEPCETEMSFFFVRRSHDTRVLFDGTAKVISGTDSPVWSKLPQLESVGGKAVLAFHPLLKRGLSPDRMP